MNRIWLFMALICVVWAQIKMSANLSVSDALLSAPIGFVVLYLIGKELSGLTQRTPDAGGRWSQSDRL